MSQPLYLQLLHQARRLARLDPRRPQQGNLRRAVSAAYYSLFHFLIDRSSRYLAGSSRSREPGRLVLTRAYGHAEMLAVARAFEAGNFPAVITRIMPVLPVPRELHDVAELFRILQVQRHRADYDLVERFARQDLLDFVDAVERAFRDWRTIRNDPAARLFLICLLVWDRVRSK